MKYMSDRGVFTLASLVMMLLVGCSPEPQSTDQNGGAVSPDGQTETPAEGAGQADVTEDSSAADPEDQSPPVADAAPMAVEFNVERRTLLERGGFTISELGVRQLGSTLIVAEFSQTGYSAEVVGVEPEYPSGISTVAAVERQNAEFVIGSGYVESFVPPVPSGLLVVDNTTLSTVNEGGFSTLVAVSRGNLSLLPKESWADESINGAFQVGPRLVESGEAQILDLKKGSATRAFVGLREDNSVVAGVTLDRVDLQLLANFLVAPTQAGGLGTVDAVNLAGGGSEAFLYSKDGDQFSYGNVKARQASLLAFRSRPSRLSRSDVSAAVAIRAGIDPEESAACIDAALEVIASNLDAGRKVNVANFGTFSVMQRAARSGRNPRTGEQIKIEATRVPAFKSSRALKERVNDEQETGDGLGEPDVNRAEQPEPGIDLIAPDLVGEISSMAGLDTTAARTCTTAFFEEVADALARGASVSLVGFGTFSISNRAARTGRNPQTGSLVYIPATKAVSFKASKGLKDAVN